MQTHADTHTHTTHTQTHIHTHKYMSVYLFFHTLAALRMLYFKFYSSQNGRYYPLVGLESVKVGDSVLGDGEK